MGDDTPVPDTKTKEILIQCRFQEPKSCAVLFKLTDPNVKIDVHEQERRILDHCLSLIEQGLNVYWLQNRMPEPLTASTTVPFNPLIYKKIHLYAMLPEYFSDGLEYICKHMTRGPRHHLAGIVVSILLVSKASQTALIQINLQDYRSVSGHEALVIIEFMRKLSMFFRDKFDNDERDKHRTVIHLPATKAVMTAIARQNADRTTL